MKHLKTMSIQQRPQTAGVAMTDKCDKKNPPNEELIID
jgi:hypothetical protein